MRFKYGDKVRFNSSQGRIHPELHNQVGKIEGVFSECANDATMYFVAFKSIFEGQYGLFSTAIIEEKHLILTKSKVKYYPALT